mmetsp:Transcript_84083/g.234533  ORF Transcript_84083/g.234533 Transcript_84083/m.234533 type:complete len:94 (+) Transcript_84083:53-334(+)
MSTFSPRFETLQAQVVCNYLRVFEGPAARFVRIPNPGVSYHGVHVACLQLRGWNEISTECDVRRFHVAVATYEVQFTGASDISEFTKRYVFRG